MNKFRDSKTGRFISKPTVEPAAKMVTQKSASASDPMKVQLLINPLAVFAKKDLTGPSNMKTGTTVILQEINDLIRVKKENSSRTFYTTKENVQEAI